MELLCLTYVNRSTRSSGVRIIAVCVCSCAQHDPDPCPAVSDSAHAVKRATWHTDGIVQYAECAWRSECVLHSSAASLCFNQLFSSGSGCWNGRHRADRELLQHNSGWLATSWSGSNYLRNKDDWTWNVLVAA